MMDFAVCCSAEPQLPNKTGSPAGVVYAHTHFSVVYRVLGACLSDARSRRLSLRWGCPLAVNVRGWGTARSPPVFHLSSLLSAGPNELPLRLCLRIVQYFHTLSPTVSSSPSWRSLPEVTRTDDSPPPSPPASLSCWNCRRWGCNSSFRRDVEQHRQGGSLLGSILCARACAPKNPGAGFFVQVFFRGSTHHVCAAWPPLC